MILSFAGKTPKRGADTYLAETATLIGDVELGDRASIWFGAVLRGDAGRIHVGRDSNIQDLTVIHADSHGFDTLVGEQVTVGHRVVLHGCTVRDRALIGIGAVLLNGCEIGEETIVGAGSLVTEGKKMPPGMLVLGSPARAVRPLTAEERASIALSAAHYVELAAGYR